MAVIKNGMRARACSLKTTKRKSKKSMSTLKSDQIKSADPAFTPAEVAARERYYLMIQRVLREDPTHFLDHYNIMFPIVQKANAAIDRRNRLEARHDRRHV